MPDSLNICLPGNVDPFDSYGLLGVQLARHLTRMGIHVNVFAMGERQMNSHDQELAEIVRKPIHPVLGSIMLGYPTGYMRHTNPLLHAGPRIAITMFESSRLPADWIAPLNEMDAVIVPSWFCHTIFRDSGVTERSRSGAQRIHVVPLGIGESYQYRPRTTNRPLTFLAFFDRGERKGGMVAQQAFTHAFGDNTAYRLILKGRTAKPGRVLAFSNPNIEVIQQDLSEAELYELYCRCDILVNPHKGEGFGLIPREAASSGMLAMTTGWSGTADDIEQWGHALPYTLEPAHWYGNKTLQGQDLGEWARVDARVLAHHLQTVAATWQWSRLLLPGKAEAARRLYSWRVFAECVLNIYEGVASGNHVRAAAA